LSHRSFGCSTAAWPGIISATGGPDKDKSPVFDETYWRELRKRLRERTSRQMAVILCPFLAIGAVMKIMEPTNYPVGDLRNEIAFRLVFYGAFIAFATVGFVLSLRWLLNDRRAG
jgi:hypothetical protein